MKILVTDHALLRYIERVHDIDLDKLREHIAKDVEVAAKVGATTITIDDHVYCLVERENGDVAVTTVLDTDMRSNRRMHHRRKGHYDRGRYGR